MLGAIDTHMCLICSVSVSVTDTKSIEYQNEPRHKNNRIRINKRVWHIQPTACRTVHLYISRFPGTYYLVPGNMITYQHKYKFTTVVTTVCSDNDVLYPSGKSLDKSGADFDVTTESRFRRFKSFLWWDTSDGHVSVRLQIEAVAASCSQRSSNLLRLYFSSEQQLLPHIRLLSKILSMVTGTT